MIDILKKINSGGDVGYEEALSLFDSMLSGGLTEAQIAAVLISIKFRGESIDYIAALVSIMLKHKKSFNIAVSGGIDTCGTGGDGKSTLNVSTAVSIILSSMGLPVVKHGNVAQSGVVGSADILSEMGMDLSYNGSSAENFFKKHGYVFMLAPNYHPALKNIGKVRREIAVPTIFNFVGPLVNPASPAFQIIGTGSDSAMKKIAGACGRIGRSGVIVYSSRDGYDEVSTNGITDCIFVNEGSITPFQIDPADFFRPFPMPVVKSRDEAIDLFARGLSGCDDRLTELLSINTALALFAAKGIDLKHGFDEAYGHIKKGLAAEKLNMITKR
jgi:anthranilate phosphoribosyltransferase